MGPYLASLRRSVGSRCVLVPGVRAVIVNECGEVLLQRRKDLGCWGLPAGSVELDETAAEALRREVREETALEIHDAEPMALYSGPGQRFRYPNGDEIQAFSVAFVVRSYAGTPTPDGVEGDEVRFFPIEALPEHLVPIHAETLADYRNYRGRFMLAGDAGTERKDE